MVSKHTVGIGLAICTPIPHVPGPLGPRLAMITTEWHRARQGLIMPTNFIQANIQCDGMEVGDARNVAVETAFNAKPRPAFLMYVDYDVIPTFDAVTKLLYRAQHFDDYDIFAGVYCSKTSVPEPLIYKGDGKGCFWDWAVGDLLLDGITGCHMGMTLIRMSLFDRMEWDDQNPLFHTTDDTEMREDGIALRRGTEDLYFCRRAIKEANAKILVDTSVLCGHIDHGSGLIYGLPADSKPVKRAQWMPAATNKEYQKSKKALDLGAGEHKRSWDGYKTYSTDIRPGIGVDYVMDTRLLNFPDNHFDLVASSHHLEHLGRWDQEKVWDQIFKVCKPGGKIEHVMPNIEWAAAMIEDSREDGNVLNVLYGAQEEHGYKREYNTHFFGYTPAIGKALAEQAGFVKVKCETYKENPKLGYNLIITGEKPALKDIKKKQKPLFDDEPSLHGSKRFGRTKSHKLDKLIGHRKAIVAGALKPSPKAESNGHKLIEKAVAASSLGRDEIHKAVFGKNGANLHKPAKKKAASKK